MRSASIDILIAIAVLAAWIGTAGFVRLATALDRLHCAAFVVVGCGLPIVVAAFVADGPSTRAFKLLALWLIALVAGAGVNQAVARAIFTRDEVGERA